jgi:hypothetical protein
MGDSSLDCCVPGLAPSLDPPVRSSIEFRYVEFRFRNRAREKIFLSLNLGDEFEVMTVTDIKMENISIPEKLG